MKNTLEQELIMFEQYITAIIDVRLAQIRSPEYEPTLEIRNMEAERVVFLKALEDTE